MRRCLVLIGLLAYSQGGPYKLKPRDTAKPLVANAQWFVHERLLQVEKRVLQASLDVGRLAHFTTQEAYRLTDVADARMESLVSVIRQDARRIRSLAPECVDNKRLKKAIENLKNVTKEVYLCTHALSDTGASFEVEMTQILVTARSQVWDVQQAMWYCQKYQPQVDTECLKRLMLEGLYLLDKLPERGMVVLDNAYAARAQSLAKLRDCFVRSVSAAEVKRLAETQKMRKCAERTEEKREFDAQKEVLTKEIEVRMI